MKTLLHRTTFAIGIGVILLASAAAVQAQTSAFSYQGKLYETGVAANGNYTMKFRLYTLASGGTQVGSEISQSVSVATGIFNVSLDFGAASFPASANRWLEIQLGTTILTPRQQVVGSPFAIRSLNANSSDLLSSTCNPCVTDGQIIGLSGAKITGNVANADNATTASNATNLGGVAAANYLLKSGGVITGSLGVTGVISGDGSGLTNLPNTGFAWLVPSGTSAQMQSNKGFFFKDSGQVTATLPTSPNIGDVVRVSNVSTGGIKIAQIAGQAILQDVDFVPVVSPIWGNGTDASPGSAINYWRGLAASADGQKLVACALGGALLNTAPGGIYTSTDGGFSWTFRLAKDNIISVASSSDGTKLVAAESGGQIYTSTDSGASWTARETNRSWVMVASSANGTILGAVTNGASGHVYRSFDSGVTWSENSTQLSSYRGIAISATGTRWVVLN